MADTVEILASKFNETSNNTATIGRKGEDSDVLPNFYTQYIDVWNGRIKEFTQEIGSDILIWNHPTQGFWGDFKWSSDYGNDLVLQKVRNGHDLFYESFGNERFIDTSSTGSSNLSSNYYFIGDTGSYLQTEYIAKEDKVYKSIKININAEYSDSSDATGSLNIVAQVGSDNFTLTKDITNYITTTYDTGLKLKISNNDTTQGIYLKSFLVKYTS